MQREAFEKIMEAVTGNMPKLFFLHGPAGTGKTFTYNTLCYKLQGNKKIVLCCASSGIAALLLPKGRTAHSTFKIPIDIFEGRICSIKRNSDLGKLLQEVSLIIWDEVLMQNHFCQEAVDLTMQDIRANAQPFGGVTVVFGGDFQQILPVIRKGRREQIVGACIQRSYLWHQIKVLYLTENKQLSSGTVEDCEDAKWLLKVGHGSDNDTESQIKLDPSMKCGDTIDSLVESIYPGLDLIDPKANND